MAHVVVATYIGKNGEAGEVSKHLKAMIGPTKAEPGCQVYRVVNSTDDPNTFVLFEVYDDEAAFKEHVSSEHFEEHIRDGAWNHIESRSVVFGSELEG
jgi:quinol monooxygenase YgiN